MSVKKSKDDTIDEIRNLRSMIGDLSKALNEDEVELAQKKLNRIQDMVFNI